jgi:hypothetical protein
MHDDYERYLSLYLNRARGTHRQAYAIQLGIEAGMGKHSAIGKKMKLPWYQSLAESNDEALFMYQKSRMS